MFTEVGCEPEATVSLGDTYLGSSRDNSGAITGSVHSSTVIGRQNNIYHNYSAKPVEAAIQQPEKADNIPLWQNPKFYGRQSELSDLHTKLCTQALSTSENRQSSCLIHGIGGVGKTQVALQYAYQCRGCYDFVFWVHSETEPVMTRDMISIADILKLDRPPNTGDGAVVSSVRNWFQNTGQDRKWLLIFDNVESLESLIAYRPRSKHGSVLLTSQNASLGSQTTYKIFLNPFGPLDSRSSLLSYLDEDRNSQKDTPTADDDAALLCHELGGLPIAIAHVAGYMTESGVSVRQTLEMLRSRRETADIFGAKPDTTFGYPKALGLMWDIALRELNEQTLKVLQVLCMLHSDCIPQDIFYGHHPEPNLAFLSSIPRTRILAMMSSLSRRQLISKWQESGRSYLAIHRVLQRCILHRLDAEDGKIQEIFMVTFALLRRVFPRQSSIQFPQNDQWNVWEIWSPHIMNLRKVYEESEGEVSASIEFAEILGDVANYFWERNMLSDGILASDSAGEICEKLDGQFLHQQGHIFTLGACIRLESGISTRSECFRLMNKALLLRQCHMNTLVPSEATEIDVQNYANAWSNLAWALSNYGFYEDAIAYSDFAIAIRNRIGCGSVKINADTLTNKCLCLAALGIFDEAKKLIITDREIQSWPPEFLKTVYVSLLKFKFYWATIYLQAGDTEKAYEMINAVLATCSAYFGPWGSPTLDCYYIMSLVQESRGNIEEAKDLLKMAITRPDSWIEEAKLRAQYHLSRMQAATEKTTNSHICVASLRNAKEKLWDQYAVYVPPDVNLDESAIYDHMVALSSGRTSFGKGIPGKTPEMNKVCYFMKSALESALPDGEVFTPREVVRYLKYDGSIPEEQFYYRK